MERVWHGCEKVILRDQTTFKGAHYFEVRETKTFWIVSGLERKSMKLLVLFFDTIFQIAYFLPRWKLDQLTLFLMFSDFECRIFFSFWRAFLWEGCENCNSCLKKIFLKRWQVLRNSFFFFVSLIAKISDFWHKKLLHGFKNRSSSDHRIFSRKRIHQWKL